LKVGDESGATRSDGRDVTLDPRSWPDHGDGEERDWAGRGGEGRRGVQEGKSRRKSTSVSARRRLLVQLGRRSSSSRQVEEECEREQGSSDGRGEHGGGGEAQVYRRVS
jgi:hypothetical protein